MATIIRVTNPIATPKLLTAWKCPACGSKYDDEAETRACAEEDHATGRHKR